MHPYEDEDDMIGRLSDEGVNTYREIGALAQAARNYLLTGSPYDRKILNRLSAAALRAEPIPDEEGTR